jgi:hypothetical protein
MRVKAGKHGAMKGLYGSNPPLSANESAFFTYNLEMAEISARDAAPCR